MDVTMLAIIAVATLALGIGVVVYAMVRLGPTKTGRRR